MSYQDHYTDDYNDYETMFDPMQNDRQARRKRKPKVNHAPKKSEWDVINDLADETGLAAGFEVTYQPSLYEAEWLMSSLSDFFERDLITDVLALVKGGKEASVYRCRAHPSTGVEWLAAKVYRPRKFRQLRNDKMYREGRQILGEGGKPVDDRDERVFRAISKKTAFGVQIEHTSWLMHEFATLDTLYQAGAAVPKPYAAGENAILMTYIGDEYLPAPTLNAVDLDPDEVEPLFAETLRNIELMLQHGRIHGDLSAYNILYWAGDITLIDFPQVTDCHVNSSAQPILERDITRVCEYFAGQGVACDPDSLAHDLWQRYAAKDPVALAADLSRLEVEDEEDE